ncbi:hypothetical protein PVAP13_3KG120627 [Panicum virgatum]|uniref:Uncharacterized protein n=1 Tax=Panicum virgatum TaxID=38727 RepID=A0A8T0UT18_PANVG|nr:hypothetical protein PVAP13_3KG120627 [Panicum virgatum]
MEYRPPQGGCAAAFRPLPAFSSPVPCSGGVGELREYAGSRRAVIPPLRRAPSPRRFNGCTAKHDDDGLRCLSAPCSAASVRNGRLPLSECHNALEFESTYELLPADM